MNIKLGTTRIFIKDGVLNGEAVKNTSVDIAGLYLVKTYTFPETNITISHPEVTLTRDNFNCLVTITANSELTFTHDNLVGLEEEVHEVNQDGMHHYLIRVVHAFNGTGIAKVKAIAADDTTAEITVDIQSSY